MGVGVPEDVQDAVNSNQTRLIGALCQHQELFSKLKDNGVRVELHKQLDSIRKLIFDISYEQKELFQKIRTEAENSSSCPKVEEIYKYKAAQLNNSIAHARKQNMVVRCASSTPIVVSDESSEAPSRCTTPETGSYPDDLSEEKFLRMFGLVTHDAYDHLLVKRAERRKRNATKSQYFHSQIWDMPPARKKKRGAYLISSFSPPHTRGSVKKSLSDKDISPRSKYNSHPVSPDGTKRLMPHFPPIPHLPRGLTIECVSPNRRSPDTKVCVVCGQSDSLSICEVCFNGFHISCHNRPVVEPPRKCPKCHSGKDLRTIGALTVPSGMCVSYTSSEIKDKIQEKERLLDKNKTLYAELTQLQDRHSHLTISIKNQRSAQEELEQSKRSTQDKIDDLLTFITDMKSCAVQQEEKL